MRSGVKETRQIRQSSVPGPTFVGTKPRVMRVILSVGTCILGIDFMGKTLFGQSQLLVARSIKPAGFPIANKTSRATQNRPSGLKAILTLAVCLFTSHPTDKSEPILGALVVGSGRAGAAKCGARPTGPAVASSDWPTRTNGTPGSGTGDRGIRVTGVSQLTGDSHHVYTDL